LKIITELQLAPNSIGDDGKQLKHNEKGTHIILQIICVSLFTYKITDYNEYRAVYVAF